MGSSDALKCLLHFIKCCDLFINVFESKRRDVLPQQKPGKSLFFTVFVSCCIKSHTEQQDGEKGLKVMSFQKIKSCSAVRHSNQHMNE